MPTSASTLEKTQSEISRFILRFRIDYERNECRSLFSRDVTVVSSTVAYKPPSLCENYAFSIARLVSRLCISETASVLLATSDDTLPWQTTRTSAPVLFQPKLTHGHPWDSVPTTGGLFRNSQPESHHTKRYSNNAVFRVYQLEVLSAAKA